MATLSRYKGVIIIGVLIITGFFVYSYLFTGTATPPLSSQDVSASTFTVDADLIQLLVELKAITLDDSIFTDQGFQSLQDFGKELVPEASGRANPFAPLGGVHVTPGAQGISQGTVSVPSTRGKVGK